MQQKRTLDEVKKEAEVLRFTLKTEGKFFEMNKGELGGTFTYNQAGIEEVYDYLVRYRHRLEQINELRGRRL
jgi:hypothetical protein